MLYSYEPSNSNSLTSRSHLSTETASGGRVRLIEKSRPDRDDLRLDLVEHFAVIAKRLRRLALFGEPLARCRSPRLIGIGDGDDFALRNIQPDRIDPVTIVAFASVTDDGDAKSGGHGAVLGLLEKSLERHVCAGV